MPTEKCPDCEASIEVSNDALVGEIVSCPDCGLELEITEVNGGQVQLKELTLEKEDWGE